MQSINIQRNDLKQSTVSISGRDLVIGFSEPAFRPERKEDFMLGAPLNARLLSYFLPAVDIARCQPKGQRRPRLILISGIKAAIKWNAKTDEERKIMLMNNNLKKDFLARAFERFFPEDFCLVDIRDTIDFLKIPSAALQTLWDEFCARYPEKTATIEQHLGRFRPEESERDHLFQYALAHLFGMGDVNFDWEPHQPNGYCSIGEHHEALFNEVREAGLQLLKENDKRLFGRKALFFDNMKIVIHTDEKSPPPYNGAHRSAHGKTELDEVTYENERELAYYEIRPRLLGSMNYLYSLIPQEQYQRFWNEYRERYFSLKRRYEEAYML